MTIKDLQKLIEEHTTNQEPENPDLNMIKSKLYSRYTKQGYKPFYIWPEHIHVRRYEHSNGNCCFWHIIGCPKKDGHDMPMLPYQHLLWNSLQEHKCILIKKSRGIGCSEFLLRYIAYCCLAGKFQEGSRVCITVGPRIDLAEVFHISRFRGLFSKVAPNLFDRTKSTVAILNGVRLEAFPSYNSASMRGLDSVRFIMSDESDFYPKFQQQEIRAVAEGYLAKPNSDLTIIFVSTPKAPGGLIQQIELEKDSLYYKLFFTYHYGLEGPMPIYSKEQIDIAKKSPEFGREYEGKYLGLVGNVFSQLSIENATKIQYSPDNI